MNSFSKPFRLALATTVVALAGLASQTAFAAPADGPVGGPMGGPGMMMHRGMGDHGGMAMDGRHMGRMLDLVNATADQRSHIKTIMDAARKDLTAMRSSSRALHQQSQALFAQPNIDARAAETLRQQMMAQHDASSKRMLQAMLDSSAVLTADQRKLLADKMAQRRGMMERHRAERQQLDAPAPK